MPHVDPRALESLVWETHGGGSRRFDLETDDGAAVVVDSACRRVSTLRYDASLAGWVLAGVAIAAATGASVAAIYGDFVAPLPAWYDWPFLWVGMFLAAGVALAVVYGVTFFAHDWWWQRFGGGRRDAEFYGDPFARRPGAARPGSKRLLGER